MRIGVDLDNCIADLWRCALPYAEQMFGTHVDLDDITEWDMWHCMGISKDEFMAFHDACLDGAVTIEPVPGALEALDALRHEDHSIGIVTARPERFADVTARWLADNGLQDIPLVIGRSDKGDVDDWDAFIDDALHTCLALCATVPLVVLFDRPWNRSVSVERPIRRTTSWPETLTILRGSQCAR